MFSLRKNKRVKFLFGYVDSGYCLKLNEGMSNNKKIYRFCWCNCADCNLSASCKNLFYLNLPYITEKEYKYIKREFPEMFI